MPRHRLALPVLLLLACALAAGCSKGSKSTNPAVLPLELDRTLAPGATYEHRFFTESAYPYHCSIHPGMTGIVIVTHLAPATDSLMGVDITDFDFTPGSVTIPVGGKVTWTNIAPNPHTVTSD